MMAFSATYPEYLAKHLTRYMREPTFVRLNATDPSLQGTYIEHRLGSQHCVLWQDNLVSECLSPPRSINGSKELSEYLYNNLQYYYNFKLYRTGRIVCSHEVLKK